MKSILDPSFKYTSSANTDIAKTFARIRRLQRQNDGPAPSHSVLGRDTNVAVFRRKPTADSPVCVTPPRPDVERAGVACDRWGWQRQ